MVGTLALCPPYSFWNIGFIITIAGVRASPNLFKEGYQPFG
jgi:hypothetical protein